MSIEYILMLKLRPTFIKNVFRARHPRITSVALTLCQQLSRAISSSYFCPDKVGKHRWHHSCPKKVCHLAAQHVCRDIADFHITEPSSLL